MSIVKGAALAAILATSISLPAVSMAHTSRDEGALTHKKVYNSANKPAVVDRPASSPAPEPLFLNYGGVG
jgi:hypothetical protein